MSAVLPAPNPEPAPPARADRPAVEDRRRSQTKELAARLQVADPLAAQAARLVQVAGKRKVLLLLFVAAGVAAAWIGSLFQSPQYQTEALIEIRSAVPAADAGAFVTTQAKLLESTVLRRRAVNRIQRDHPGDTYQLPDRLTSLRGALGPYLPAAASRKTVPIDLEIETYGGARVIRLRASASDARYAALFVNALGDEYIGLGGSDGAAGWPEAAARFIDRAETPNAPANQSRAQILAWGGLAGLLVGFVAVASKRSEQATRLSVPGDIRSRLQMRELGAIPWANSVPDPIPGNPVAGNALLDVVFGRQTNARTTPAETAVWQDQASLLAEAFRSATTSLLLVKTQASRPRVVVITSAHRGEGKTTAVLNLGAALADLNLKVLVLDADLRNPRLHQILDLSNSWGLSDLLQERIPLGDVPVEALVRTCSIPNLAVVCSGPPTLNVASLLYSDRMEELVARFRLEFDVILIDTPPALVLSDARLAARLADTVAIVVRAGETSDADVIQLRERFAEDGIAMAGALLNGWRCNETAAGARLAGVRLG